MTFGADVPSHLHQPPQAYDCYIGVKPISCRNDALDQTDYLPPFLAIITHPSLLTYTYVHVPSESLFRERSTGRGEMHIYAMYDNLMSSRPLPITPMNDQGVRRRK